MSYNESFSSYRNQDITLSSDDDEFVEASNVEYDSSKISNSSENEGSQIQEDSSKISNSSENEGSQEIPETETESEDEIIVKKKVIKKNVVIESSDEEAEEKKAIYSPRTRRSIHGVRNIISSDEEESSSEFDESKEKTNIESGSIDSSRNNSNENEDKKTEDMESREISKFSKIYDSKNIADHSVDHNKSGNASMHFNSSIINKMSSTITDTSSFANKSANINHKNSSNSKSTITGTSSYANKSANINNKNSSNSVLMLENKMDVIEIDTSDESVSLVTSTPDILGVNEKKLAQPKITAALIDTPKSSYTKSSAIQPQFVSKEFLSREIRKLDELKTELATCNNLLKANVNLPDGGAKMRDRIEKCKIQIKKHANYVSNLVVDQDEIKANRSNGIDQNNEDPSRNSTSSSNTSFKAPTWDELAAAVNAIQPKHTGSQGLATFAAQKAMTVDRLKDIHGSLENCPDENVLAETPKGLKIELMTHQKHALAWMQWRETQKPRGGILADDMGLGKTLTMISLIIAQNENQNEDSKGEDSDEEENNSNSKGWLSKGRKDYYDGGTLIVCPASLLQQWENEIANRCKRNLLGVVVHHGNNRDTKPRHLAKNDVVITTYHIVSREFKNDATLLKIKWNRVILDEGHVIRNHKAQISISVCGLKSRSRWVLTGTPVQNKEMDLYAIIKFLKCSPFDDLAHWKKWIDNKSAGGQARLNTLMKSLLLRRTKMQLQQSGENFKLPEKTINLVEVILEKEEMNVYQRVMTYSQTLFAQFLHQRTEKENDLHYGNANNAPTFMQIKDPNGAFFKMHKKMSKITGNNQEVKSFEILVLLLRLRQICCHPGLIDSMLEEEDLTHTENSDEYKEVDLLKQLEKLQIDEKTEGSSDSFDSSHEDSMAKAAARVLKRSNPVFNKDIPSSKLNKVLEILEEILTDNNDKAIIVSQWTALLDILKLFLGRKGFRTVSLNGTVPVKNRNEIVTSFNDEKCKTRIMLLSLTAGGVGLNLIGANHLLLIDLHWNPQLESQAQDRIYRVGQKKPVYIYKFMVKDTVEERIKKLQDTKLEIANNVLTGGKSVGSKLTMEDLKGLFGL